MKKNVKRIICFALSVIALSCFIIPAGAADGTESATEAFTLDVFPGYVHEIKQNEVITYQRNAAAARDILRCVARLEDFDDYQKEASDVNFDGRVTAADARILLRYTAGLCGFPIELKVGQEFRFGPFTAWWTLEALTESTDELKIEREVIPPSEDAKPGDGGSYVLHVTPCEPGEYTLEVEYRGYTDEVEKTARFDITCVE